MNHTVEHETDWLGINFVYYDLTQNIWSANLSELLSEQNAAYSEEGLKIFLKNGFMGFGQTIFKNIKFTLSNESIVRDNSGKLSILENEDPTLISLEEESNVDEVRDLLSKWFFKFLQNNLNSTVILPLSGGLDSRMLASYLRDKPNVRAFTYGVSTFQGRSYEAVLARECARNFNIDWQLIRLGSFHNFLEMSSDYYGPSMHAHSMYHFEFFNKIKEVESERVPLTVLSGIYGDVWAGSWKFEKPILIPQDLLSLSLNHGVVFRGKNFMNSTTQTEAAFLEKKKDLLSSSRYRIIEAARLKAPLIRHLIYTPIERGFNVDSPFLDVNISMAMLRLPQHLRENRMWQRELVENIQPKHRLLPINRHNNLDLLGTYKVPLKELAVDKKWFHGPLLEMLDELDFTPPRVTKLGMAALYFSEFRRIVKCFPKIVSFKQNLLSKYANYVVLYPLSRIKIP
jgi:hypothetical protein